MIGRGCLGNPFLIREAISYIEHGITLPPAAPSEKLAAARHHLKLACHFKGADRGTREMRKQLAWYIKGFPYAASTRVRINEAQTPQGTRNHSSGAGRKGISPGPVPGSPQPVPQLIWHHQGAKIFLTLVYNVHKSCVFRIYFEIHLRSSSVYLRRQFSIESEIKWPIFTVFSTRL